MTAEENGIVLDYMPTGKPSAVRTEPMAQIIGKDYFTLLEVVPKKGIALSVGEEVYIGKDERAKVELVKGRISFKDLTSSSISEIEGTITDLIEANKEKYLNFYNTARGISLKRHQLELLPGMGKKHMLDLLDQREKGKFTSFEDIIAKVKGVPDPMKAIVKRIMEELEDPEDKHFIFVRPPSAPKKQFYPRKRY
jgi:putative nucleotide binding protein